MSDYEDGYSAGQNDCMKAVSRIAKEATEKIIMRHTESCFCPECVDHVDAAKLASQRRHVVPSAGYWFTNSRVHQEYGRSAEALLCMENAYNHVENAYCAIRDKVNSLSAEIEASWWRKILFRLLTRGTKASKVSS